MDITVMTPCARDDYSIVGLPETHVLGLLYESLKSQSFKGTFEWIIIDALYNERGVPWSELKETWIKRIPPKSSIWDELGAYRVCSHLNTALIHAKGELIVRMDDCSQCLPDYLDMIWRWYKKGFWPLSLYLRAIGDKINPTAKDLLAHLPEEIKKNPSREKELTSVFKPNEIVRDTRYPTVENSPSGIALAKPEWVYGYVAVPLEALLKVNGYDELFDGCKSLEDCDCGMRIDASGYKGKFILDKNLFIVENEHLNPSSKVMFYKGKPMKCNHSILLWNKINNRWRVNDNPLSEEAFQWIREDSAKSPCSWVEGKDYDFEEGFKYWKTHQPNFDLRELRKKVGETDN